MEEPPRTDRGREYQQAEHLVAPVDAPLLFTPRLFSLLLEDTA